MWTQNNIQLANWLVTLIIISLHSPFKSFFGPSFLAGLCFEGPVCFDDPCSNQLTRRSCHHIAILDSLGVYPILPLFCHCVIGLFTPTSIGWHRYVQPPRMYCTSMPRAWMSSTMDPIMWTRKESKMRRGTQFWGRVFFHGERHFAIQSLIMDSSIHAFFEQHKLP